MPYVAVVKDVSAEILCMKYRAIMSNIDSGNVNSGFMLKSHFALDTVAECKVN